MQTNNLKRNQSKQISLLLLSIKVSINQCLPMLLLSCDCCCCCSISCHLINFSFCKIDPNSYSNSLEMGKEKKLKSKKLKTRR